MATNYKRGTSAGIGDPLNRKASGDAYLAFYMEKFYAAARGHLLNKYHVGFWGEYVSEALRVMDRNAYADKYTLSNTKTFKDTGDLHWKAAFNDWLDMFYDRSSKVLNMYWACESATVKGNTANPMRFGSLDTTKQMQYPLLTGDAGPKDLQLQIVDDPYMMWYQFFNALFNVQFSPLVLKARSTWHKINVAIDVYSEATTIQRSGTGQLATQTAPYITDIALNQMFEFNSAVLKNSPDMKLGFSENNPYKFSVSFAYPNCFHGTFKTQLRYLRDNTRDGSDANALEKKTDYNTFRHSFYEETYRSLQATKKAFTYETFNPTEYYSDYGMRTFKKKDD